MSAEHFVVYHHDALNKLNSVNYCAWIHTASGLSYFNLIVFFFAFIFIWRLRTIERLVWTSLNPIAASPLYSLEFIAIQQKKEQTKIEIESHQTNARKLKITNQNSSISYKTKSNDKNKINHQANAQTYTHNDGVLRNTHSKP